MAATPQRLLEWKEKLEKLDSTRCIYAHHKGDKDGKFGPLCHPEVQNNRHGCVHAMFYVLRLVADEMRGEGEITQDKHYAIHAALARHKPILFEHGDQVVALEFIDRETEHHLGNEQQKVIDERAEFTAHLLEHIESRLGSDMQD